jgi:hypothetical protein
MRDQGGAEHETSNNRPRDGRSPSLYFVHRFEAYETDSVIQEMRAGERKKHEPRHEAYFLQTIATQINVHTRAVRFSPPKHIQAT